jgi:hypothetical protein
VRRAGRGEATVRLEPWLPANATFNGCARGCGVRATDRSGVKAQPGAMLGQLVLRWWSCSDQLSARRDLGGRTLYFCCESAQYFSQNQAGSGRWARLRSASSGSGSPGRIDLLRAGECTRDRDRRACVSLVSGREVEIAPIVRSSGRC